MEENVYPKASRSPTILKPKVWHHHLIPLGDITSMLPTSIIFSHSSFNLSLYEITRVKSTRGDITPSVWPPLRVSHVNLLQGSWPHQNSNFWQHISCHHISTSLLDHIVCHVGHWLHHVLNPCKTHYPHFDMGSNLTIQ